VVALILNLLTRWSSGETARPHIWPVCHVQNTTMEFNNHITRRCRSSVNYEGGGEQDIFAWKLCLLCMPKFYTICARKIIKMPKFLWYLPEKCQYFTWQLPEKYFFVNFFLGGGARAPVPRLLRLWYHRQYREGRIIFFSSHSYRLSIRLSISH